MSENFFALKADLGELVGDRKIISATVGPDGEACLFAVAARDGGIALGREERKGFAIFPLSRARNSYEAMFMRYRDCVLQRTELKGVEQAFPTVEALPNGEILLVGARCHYRDGNPEKNAVVFGPDGREVRRFVLGDGIADVQTTKEGLIWVSYFDEGVFGNFGWNEPMGAAGIVCFNARGEKVWDFVAPSKAGMVADCYAMNVAGDAVWACYYTDFPVVRIDAARKVRAWRNSVAGASAMAVNNRHVVLWGGYGEERMRCIVQEYSESEPELKNSREIGLEFPAEVDAKGLRVTGRGAGLHAFVGARWYRWTMNA
ncbi:MAG TPA: hypothetical protein VI282_11405 [Verrucomicrobiae bacterium]